MHQIQIDSTSKWLSSNECFAFIRVQNWRVPMWTAKVFRESKRKATDQMIARSAPNEEAATDVRWKKILSLSLFTATMRHAVLTTVLMIVAIVFLQLALRNLSIREKPSC